MSRFEVDADLAWQWLTKGRAALIDLRPIDVRFTTGEVPGSQAVIWQQLDEQTERLLMDGKDVLLLCEVGQDSLKYCQLKNEDNLWSVAGGMDAWFLADLPLKASEATERHLRYDRQTRLSYWGEGGQERLFNSHVAIIGLGGLGVPALQYLAAAGIGQFTLVDDDVVALSNLPRQVIYRPDHVGISKVQEAQNWVNQHNDKIVVNTYAERLSHHSAAKVLSDANVVLDCTDNWASRQVINACCWQKRTPWVFAAVTDVEWQLSVIDPRQEGAPYWACLFPEADGESRNCETQGVVGMATGIAGTRQAAEAVKVLLGVGLPLTDVLLVENMLTNQSKMIKYRRNPRCPIHHNKR